MSESDPFSSLPNTPNEPPIELPDPASLSPFTSFAPLGPPVAPTPSPVPVATPTVSPSHTLSDAREGTAKGEELAATADGGTRSVRPQPPTEQRARFTSNRMAQSTPMLRRPGRRSSSGIAGDTLDSTASFLGPNQSFMQLISALSLEETELDGDIAQPSTPAAPRIAIDDTTDSKSQPEIDNDSASSDDEADNPRGTLSPHDVFHLASDLSPVASPVTRFTSLPATSPISNEIGSTQAGDMSSSIHAIYRPIAARRRTVTGEEGEHVQEGKYSSVARSVELEQDLEEGVVVDAMSASLASIATSSSFVGRRRAGTVNSVGRQAKLAEKLEDVFGLDEREEVVAEFKCWLFRSVLLQGFMYLTTGHICFYAYLPRKEGATLRSGSLSARGTRTRRYHKHWFILKDALLSWYPSSTDPYFPDGHVDLHYCTSVEISLKHKNHFKVSTADKKWHFSADSEASRDDWVKIIKKSVFRCQNEGESVKIAIPLETVIDIERSTNLDFAETIRVRVYDAEEGYSIDEYWLSYFADLDGALEKMTTVLEEFRLNHPGENYLTGEQSAIIDTTLKAHSSISTLTPTPSSATPLESTTATIKSAAPASQSTASWSTTLTSRLKIFPAIDRSTSSLATITDKEKLEAGTPRSASPPPSRPASSSAQQDKGHTYPPDPAPGIPPAEFASDKVWSIPIPSLPTAMTNWLSRAPSKISALPAALVTKPRKILEVVTGSDMSVERDPGAQTGFSAPEEEENVERTDDPTVEEQEKFRKSFGLSEKESVLASYSAYLFRGLPIYGKVYISTTFFCFKSVGILAKTKMILPLHDIIAVSKSRSYRIGYSGLIIVIKGHEEIFFELSSAEQRDRCIEQLEGQLEFVQYLGEEDPITTSTEARTHLDLLSLARSTGGQHSSDQSQTSEASYEGPQPPTSTSSSSQPPVMFCSTSSDFVTFRPEKSLKFTCLTIGSRGDVQPYIALCKGLMSQGHSCKIASHGEYRGWVEGHGIDFEEIGGDPAELMQLMIAHDFFTIAFMKEAVGRFRGWLDELLETTWNACQGADVLIESPSAIAGLHIAEALRIPYFRAFTMPWSRTRAYPHAFAVPDHKMGGGYNYMSYTMFDHIFWRATAGQVNRWRKKTLGLGSTNLELMQQHKIPFLYNFSPVIVPPPLDWRENIHVTGYWWLDNPDDSASSKWQPPADLLDFLALAEKEGKKVVFIGFGSIIIPDPTEMTRVVTEAVEKAGVYAIVAKGWSDRAATKDDSVKDVVEKEAREKKEETMMRRDYIFNIKSIPHDWLFPRIHAAVHHGGAGTTGASLRAGLPTIIKPFFGDQWFYADRVATLGIGSAVRDFTVDHLAAAIVTAVTDEKQIARAKLAGETIRREDGVGTAIQCIYRDLEYARSLLPPLKTSSSAPTPVPYSPNPSSARLPSTVLVTATSSTTSSRGASSPRETREGRAESRDHSSDESGWDLLGNSGVISVPSSFGDEREE